MVNPREEEADSHVVRVLNCPTRFGRSENGRARVVVPGDVIIIPAGVLTSTAGGQGEALAGATN